MIPDFWAVSFASRKASALPLARTEIQSVSWIATTPVTGWGSSVLNCSRTDSTTSPTSSDTSAI